MSITLSLSDGTIRKVESELYNYRETKRAIARRRDELADGPEDPKPIEDAGVRGSSAWSDPTCFRATVLFEDRHLREMRRFVEAIEDTHAALTPEAARLVELWYWGKATADECAQKLGISRETCYRWRKGIIAAVAARLGWQ